MNDEISSYKILKDLAACRERQERIRKYSAWLDVCAAMLHRAGPRHGFGWEEVMEDIISGIDWWRQQYDAGLTSRQAVDLALRP